MPNLWPNIRKPREPLATPVTVSPERSSYFGKSQGEVRGRLVIFWGAAKFER